MNSCNNGHSSAELRRRDRTSRHRSRKHADRAEPLGDAMVDLPHGDSATDPVDVVHRALLLYAFVVQLF